LLFETSLKNGTFLLFDVPDWMMNRLTLTQAHQANCAWQRPQVRIQFSEES